MILRLFGVLLCGLVGASVAQAQAELDAQTLRELLLPDGARSITVEGGRGLLEESRAGEAETGDTVVRGKLDILLAHHGVSFRITLQRRPVELFISWKGKDAEARTGEFSISGRYPIWDVADRAGYQGSNSLRRTEDGQGVKLEETHFPFYDGPNEKGPKSLRTDMQRVEVVIRPTKIRFLIKSLGPLRRDAIRAPLEQRFTMEFDR